MCELSVSTVLLRGPKRLDRPRPLAGTHPATNFGRYVSFNFLVADILNLRLTTLATAVCVTLAARAPALSAQPGQTVIVLGGHLFDGLGEGTVPNPGLVIRAGKFLQIGGGPAASGPDVTVIDLDDDQYVLPVPGPQE